MIIQSIVMGSSRRRVGVICLIVKDIFVLNLCSNTRRSKENGIVVLLESFISVA